jgi:hypothetical protein
MASFLPSSRGNGGGVAGKGMYCRRQHTHNTQAYHQLLLQNHMHSSPSQDTQYTYKPCTNVNKTSTAAPSSSSLSCTCGYESLASSLPPPPQPHHTHPQQPALTPPLKNPTLTYTHTYPHTNTATLLLSLLLVLLTHTHTHAQRRALRNNLRGPQPFDFYLLATFWPAELCHRETTNSCQIPLDWWKVGVYVCVCVFEREERVCMCVCTR